MSAKDQDTELLAKAVELLGEHFDAVSIFCSRHEPECEDGTVTVTDGCGNWHARFGQVREWLVRQDERARASVRSEDN